MINKGLVQPLSKFILFAKNDGYTCMSNVESIISPQNDTIKTIPMIFVNETKCGNVSLFDGCEVTDLTSTR